MRRHGVPIALSPSSRYSMRMPPPLRIGPVTLASPVLLAPMTGYTDLPFRLAVRSWGGVGLAYTEMMNPKSILYGGGKKREAMLATSAEDRPLGYQLYGSDPATMAEAARWLVQRGATLIDINMGCPQKKIARRGSGAGLLKTPLHAVQLADHIVKAVPIPVTVKLRSGWDRDGESTALLASALEATGIAAITLHARTGLQKYSGRANWNVIQQVVTRVHRIPVIGNGDITSPALAQAMFAETGCAGIMIGRAALKIPWMIRDIHAALNGLSAAPPTRQEHVNVMRRHFEAMVAYHGESVGTLLFRRWIPQYSRGLNLEKARMISLLKIRRADTLRRCFSELAE